MVERAIQTVKLVTNKVKVEGKDPYTALLQHRCAPLADSLYMLMSRTLHTKLPALPNSLQPVIINDRKQLVAHKQQQKQVYDRSAKALPLIQEGQVIHLQHNLSE